MFGGNSRSSGYRAGFRPVDRHEIVKEKSIEELNSQHVSLVGENGAEFLIGALRSRAKFSPIRAYLLIITKVRFIWKIQ